MSYQVPIIIERHIETNEWFLNLNDLCLDESVYHFAGGFLSNLFFFFLLKIMWLRKSVPSEHPWPFSDELAVVAHWFPVLLTRQEERALIHNLESRPKSDERDCFENKKTDKQEFAEPQKGKPHQMPGTGSNAQSLIQLWEAHSWRQCLPSQQHHMRSQSFEAKKTLTHIWRTPLTYRTADLFTLSAFICLRYEEESLAFRVVIQSIRLSHPKWLCSRYQGVWL